MSLELAKENYKIKNIVPGKIITRGEYTFVNPCPACGKKDHFILNKNNTYFSFSGCCKGGSIIDYLMEVEGMDQKVAIKKVLNQTGQKLSFNKTKKNTKEIKQKKIVKLCYHKLTLLERALREINNKDMFLICLLSYIESYTLKFIQTTETEKLLELCMNFIPEFDIWYTDYLKFESEV